MKVIIYFLLYLLATTGCDNKTIQKVDNKKTEQISVSLNNLIIDFIDYFDSLAIVSKSTYTPPVFEVEFSKIGESCYVSIISSDFYHEKDYEGFLIIKNHYQPTKI
ncbi:MAG TPA: hypothetical protein PKE38_16545 [Ignavibacteriaceae bacterium]|nr:hypothetical protein [Ignavibacteriaceae bacterium]